MGTPRAPQGPTARKFVDPKTQRNVNVSLWLNAIEDEALTLVAKRRDMNKSDTIRTLILEAAERLKKGK